MRIPTLADVVPAPLTAALPALLALACGGPPPTVPPAEPVGAECKMVDPPADAADPAPAAGTGRFLPAPGPKAAVGQRTQALELKGLRPQDGIHPATPVSFEQILTMRHPPSEMQWRALPAGSDARLIETIEADGDPLVRIRAMEGLSVRGPEDGHTPLAKVLADPKAEPALRRGAARAIGRGYSARADAPGTAALIAALGDGDATVREAVVKALAPHAGEAEVRTALQKRAAVEDDAAAKAAIEAALDREAR